ncbi:uncharacterized protein LOC143023777 [Oratosquilla oratoria]|uniref:uncharacterized protein LOC143023777 n=1 Tax=Oratosquilla oratoria TaxID=337810 RepID=UPI003F766859
MGNRKNSSPRQAHVKVGKEDPNPAVTRERVEIEVLLENIYALEHDGKVSTSPNLSVELLAEAGKSRVSYKSRLVDASLKKAARELRENEDIVIRRANKSAVFVLLPKCEYLQKMDVILGDSSKFERISRDPTNKLKSKCNGIINAVNAKAGGIHLFCISGDHGPGYVYEFVDLLHNKEPIGLIASFDAESLFTNVPVDETIVHRSHHQHLGIPENLLRLLLEACTKESPFRGPDGKIYRQVDGATMESPLGVLFANFYMGLVERRVLSVPHLRPFT